MASITDGNYVVHNQGKNPLVNFNFMLRVELLYDLPCKSVKSFSRELEYEFIQEGGLNDYVHMRRKPISKPSTLEIERYVGVDYFDPLPLGAELTLPIMLFVSRTPKQFIPFVTARTYVFTGCTVMKKTYGDLVADNSGLLVETTTIGYREMLCVDIPWSEVGDNIFASTPTSPKSAVTAGKSASDIKAQGQRYYNNAKESKEKTKTEFEALATDALVSKINNAVEKLSSAVSNSGKLGKALSDAETGLKDSNGESYKELANKARLALSDAEKGVRAAEKTVSQKQSQIDKLNGKKNNLENRIEENKTAIETVDEQIKKDKELAKTIEANIPENTKTIDDAKRKLEEAEKKLRSAGDKLNAAERERVEAKKKFNNEDSVAQRIIAGEKDKLSKIKEEFDAASEIYKSDRNVDEYLAEIEKYEEAKKECDAKIEAANEKKKAAAKKLADEEKKAKAAKNKKEEAEIVRNKAQNAVDGFEELEGLNVSLAGQENKKQTLEKEKAANDNEYAQVKNALDNANNELSLANSALTNAKATYKSAVEKADELNTKVSEADAEFARARSEYNLANRQIPPLRNALVNVETRKKRADTAMKDIENHEKECQSENQTLQSMPDEPLPPLQLKCDEVHKQMKNVLRQENTVHELAQYQDAAEELLREVEPLLKEENNE